MRNRKQTIGLIVGVVALLAACAPGHAAPEATLNTTTTAKGLEVAEGRPIRRDLTTTETAVTNSSNDSATQLTESPTLAPWSTGGMSVDLGRVAIALTVVIGLIFVLRWVAKKWFNIAGASSNSAARVVSRTMIAPRQQVILLQVGRRIVVACDSAGAVTTLCEITDADEIAEILGKTSAREAEARVSKSAFTLALDEESGAYSRAYSTAGDQADDVSNNMNNGSGGDLTSDPRLAADGVAAEDSDALAKVRGEIGTLLSRVRNLSGSIKT